MLHYIKIKKIVEFQASQTIHSLNVTKDYVGKYYAHVCGRRSLESTELVSVRTEARAGDWPWHVAILIRDKNTNIPKYDCGGSIISRTAVVTGKHFCIMLIVPVASFIYHKIGSKLNFFYKLMNVLNRKTYRWNMKCRFYVPFPMLSKKLFCNLLFFSTVIHCLKHYSEILLTIFN